MAVQLQQEAGGCTTAAGSLSAWLYSLGCAACQRPPAEHYVGCVRVPKNICLCRRVDVAVAGEGAPQHHQATLRRRARGIEVFGWRACAAARLAQVSGAAGSISAARKPMRAPASLWPRCLAPAFLKAAGRCGAPAHTAGTSAKPATASRRLSPSPHQRLRQLRVDVERQRHVGQRRQRQHHHLPGILACHAHNELRRRAGSRVSLRG